MTIETPGANSIVVDGEITGDEALVVRGSVKGHVKLGERFVVEEGAIVEAVVAIDEELIDLEADVVFRSGDPERYYEILESGAFTRA